MAAPSCQPAAKARRLVQLALDFFTPEPDLPVGAKKPANSISEKPPSQVGVVHDAVEVIAQTAVPVPAVFRHPRATREILLAGRLVAYEVRRRKRRTIGFSVGREGLVVSAPTWVPLQEIDQAVLGKSGWIVKKLHETRERHRQQESQRIDWQDGGVFPFLGEPVRLVLDCHLSHSVLDHGAAGETRVLRLKLPPDATPVQVHASVRAWLIQQAVPVFTARLDFFAQQLGVQWHKLSLSSAVTRWGSASSSGAIRLNWRLMHLRPDLIDYVVVHELSHLRFMDHSPRFWATVQSVMPGHAALRRELKDKVLSPQ
ncbi:Zinc metalloprotease [Polaromonas sp. CG9_12]|nr:Zinc metalloprotease [Polaromonas sp. CG9_12]